MIKLGDNNGKYNNWKYNCTYCFNTNGIFWYAKTKEKIVITILATILTLKFNNLGYIGLLPLISTVSYVWLMNIKDVKKFKWLIVFTMLMWFIYDVVIKSYTSAIFDFMNIVANIVTLFQIKSVKN